MACLGARLGPAEIAATFAADDAHPNA
jgi:hypothetical protein